MTRWGALEYGGITGLHGPLLMVGDVSGVGWDEYATVLLDGDDENRHGVVLEVDRGIAVVQVLEGSYEGTKILVAHWVIRDGQVLETAAREPGNVHRMTLEAYDAHPELEGERLVMDSDAFELRLYYDINS